MPRDANGNFNLFQPGNPVQTDTNIESNWANNTLQDIAAEITDSLSRQGKGALTGPLQIIDFDGGVPGLAFGNEPTSGLERAAAGDVRMQVQGTDRMRWRAGASQVPEVQVAGVWKEVALLEAARKVMQGVGGETAVWFHNATVPAAAGWELKVADTNARNLTIAPGGATPVGGGTIAGDIDPSAATLDVTVTNVSVDLPATTGGHILTGQQSGIQGHAHPGRGVRDGASSGIIAVVTANAQNVLETAQHNMGSVGDTDANQEHTHPLGGTASQTGGSGTGSTAAFNPRRAVGVLGLLSA